jgi:nucleoside 2-deoxyribosyltransferase
MTTKTLYLAHNFNTRKSIRKWELKIEGKFNLDLDNPFYDNPKRAAEMEVLDSMRDGNRKQRDYLSQRSAESIVEDDLDKIRKSDGLLAIANDTRIGTPMEIFFAGRILRIPVYIVSKKYAKHPWIVQHATMTFSSMAEFEKFAEKNWGRKK